MIMAGGFGSRLTSGNKKPVIKPLVEYSGVSLLSNIINKLPEDIPVFITVNKKYALHFQEWQRNVNRYIKLCIENAEINDQKMGAVSALNHWIQKLKIRDDLIVIAGDNYFDFDLANFVNAYNGYNTIVAVHDNGDIRKASKFGVVKLDGSRIFELVEKPEHPASGLVATALYLMPQRTFHYLAQYCANKRRDSLGEYISHLASVDKVDAYCFNGEWFDIGCELELIDKL